MDGRKEGRAGSPHPSPGPCSAPDAGPAGGRVYSWRYPSPGAAWSSSSRSRAVCCGVWAVWGRWEPDQLLSSQTRVRKEGFRDRAAELPQPCVWGRVQLTGDTSGAVWTSHPSVQGQGLRTCSPGPWALLRRRGAQRGTRAASPGATSWGYIAPPKGLGAFPNSVLNILQAQGDKCQNMVDLRLLLQSTDRFLTFFSETQRDGHSPSDSPHPL